MIAKSRVRARFVDAVTGGYSLRGYPPAIRHAASLCDVSSIVHNLVNPR
jgi:hypothetical protein